MFKKLFVLIICLLLPVNCFAGVYSGSIGNSGCVGCGVGLIQIGIGIWGLKQNTAYGNVTGSIYLLSGILTIGFTIPF